MKAKSFDTHLQELYESEHPDSERLEQWLDWAESENSIQSTAYSVRRVWGWLGLGSVAAIGLVLMVWSVWRAPTQTQEAIAELIRQHRKASPEIFRSSSFKTIGRQMKRLPFRVRSSGTLSRLKLSLVGGRYCSILRYPAAQLILKGRDGTRWTLYQAQTKGRLLHVAQQSITTSVYRIAFWQERRTFFALIGPRNSASELAF